MAGGFGVAPFEWLWGREWGMMSAQNCRVQYTMFGKLRRTMSAYCEEECVGELLSVEEGIWKKNPGKHDDLEIIMSRLQTFWGHMSIADCLRLLHEKHQLGEVVSAKKFYKMVRYNTFQAKTAERVMAACARALSVVRSVKNKRRAQPVMLQCSKTAVTVIPKSTKIVIATPTTSKLVKSKSSGRKTWKTSKRSTTVKS